MKKIIFTIFISTLFSTLSTLWAFDLPLIKDCPESPNCVSSKASQATHFVEPLSFNKSPEDFQKFVDQILKQYPRTKLARLDKTYAHIEFTSMILRFTDDLELFFDPIESKIHIRSASRVGYSDMGVNKRRVQKIRESLERF